jgi:hypothetical protein
MTNDPAFRTRYQESTVVKERWAMQVKRLVMEEIVLIQEMSGAMQKNVNAFDELTECKVEFATYTYE